MHETQITSLINPGHKLYTQWGLLRWDEYLKKEKARIENSSGKITFIRNSGPKIGLFENKP